MAIIKESKGKLNAKLPSIRIPSSLLEQMNKLIEEFNKNDSGFVLTLPIIVRQALLAFCSKALSEGIELKYIPQK